MRLRLIRPWEPIPLVQQNDRVRVQWDPSIPTNRMLEHRGPDVVLALKEPLSTRNGMCLQLSS